MTSIAWDNGPIFRNGAVGTEQACCCSCNVDVTESIGGENTGTLTFVYNFPQSPQCVHIVFTMPDCIADISVGAYYDYQVLYTGTVSDGTDICVLKPEGAAFVEVNLYNILPSNCSFSYRLTCGGCDCNEFP